MVPMFTYILALAAGLDKFGLTRSVGLFLGFFALLALLVPENVTRDQMPWVLLSHCVQLYPLENIYIDKIKPENIGPIKIACALSITTAIISLPVSIASGQFFMPTYNNAPLFYSLLGIGAISATGYSTFIFLIGHRHCFAGQTGYLVTFFGIVWGIVFLKRCIHITFGPHWTHDRNIFVRPKGTGT